MIWSVKEVVSIFPNGDKIVEYLLGREIRSVACFFLFKKWVCFRRFVDLKEARRVRDQMNCYGD